MKPKSRFIGVINGIDGCVLSSAYTYKDLLTHVDNIETHDFTHSATDLFGRDSIDRTLKVCNLRKTGRKIKLFVPLNFKGFDVIDDCARIWEIKVRELIEVEEGESDGKHRV